MNKSLNIFLWVLFFSLMAPSGVVLASWNAVPGDATYGWKTSMENILLAVLPSNKLKSSTNSKLTERRMGEVSKVLSGTHASEGLNNLSAQILSTKESLNKIDNAEDRAVAVAMYIQTLNEVNTQLETEQQSRTVGYLPPQQANTSDFSIKNLKRPTRTTNPNTNNNGSNVNRRTITPTQPPRTTNPPIAVQPTQPPIGQPTQPPFIPPVEPVDEEEIIEEDVSEEIDETQDEIDDIIDELEEIMEEAEEEVEDETGEDFQVPELEQAEMMEEDQQQENQEEDEQEEEE
jgi:hypothetical protein